MSQTIGFDVYGTLVDPADMGKHLEKVLGKKARAFGQLWHDKKVEYAFRRGLMQKYQDFGVCTLHALRYCMQQFSIELTEEAQQSLMSEFSNLEAFPDVAPGLIELKARGHHLVAFSNGPESAVRSLMGKSKVLPHLEKVISVDDIRTFKPSPLVYQYLMKRTKSSADNCWLISSNPWDVIGAKSTGLKAAWIQRDPAKIFDPWGIEPDLVVKDLIELSEHNL